MAKTLDDIFDDDDFGLLDTKPTQTYNKTDEDRLIDAFEEINTFYQTNKREPSNASMSEYTLASRLKELRNNEHKKGTLKAFDRFNLLGDYTPKIESLDDILDDDDLGLLEMEGDQSIFNFNHTPKGPSRDTADYIAQRTSISDKDFEKYEVMFKQVHRELKEGKRKFKEFKNAEKNLKEGNFYLVDGLLAYLEVADIDKVLKVNKSGDRVRIEGRTVTVFENGTMSNLLFRSLGKAIQKNGKLITDVIDGGEKELFQNAGVQYPESKEAGWIYILKSKSNNPDIKAIQNLHKIGFSKGEVKDRIKNAAKSATYLYDEVEEVASFQIADVNIQKFENLIHRFFGDARLSIDIENNGYRISPREWFDIPLPIIIEAINLIVNGNIIEYKYDRETQAIILK
ncbi:GIY-YIG nuclease family protein [Empedobacter falsenii]|uniref:GIY-YIG nuclease family protein n=1 Tax=Empedobacter TaxID=59734 RepID=UPI0025BC7972|nr:MULTISPECIES: GIY-YIG nuclease family protein [unclassified Empedobacter]